MLYGAAVAQPSVICGLMPSSAVIVTAALAVPTAVSPLYVVTVAVADIVVTFGKLSNHDLGTITLCEASNSSDVYSVLPPAVTVSLWRNASTALLRLTVSVPSVSTVCVIAAIVELPAAVVMFRLATFAKFHKK